MEGACGRHLTDPDQSGCNQSLENENSEYSEDIGVVEVILV